MRIAHLLKGELARQLRLRGFSVVTTEKDYLQGNQRIVFDVYAEKDNIAVIEVEEKRTAPVHNVAKTVRWSVRSRRKKRVTLVHVFFEEFYGRSKYNLERDLAVFIGMLGHHAFPERFDYVPINIPARMTRLAKVSSVPDIAGMISDRI